jgi:tetratricopeptide (TPR) repeat protein
MIRRLQPLRFAACTLLLCATALAAPKTKPSGEGGGSPEKLIKEYSEAVKKAPDDAESWYNLALAYYTAKKYDDASQAITKAAELNPNGVAAMRLTGAIAAKQGKTQAAIAAYEKARDAETKDGGTATVATVSGLASAQYDAERWEDAIKSYKAAWKLVKDGEKGDAGAIANRVGSAYLKSGNAKEAGIWFERSTEGQPVTAATAYNMGMTYRTMALGGDATMWAAAADRFKTAADLDPSDVFAQYFAGEALALSGRNAEAAAYLDRYIAADPGGKKAVAKFGPDAKAGVYDEAVSLRKEVGATK